MDDVTLAIRGGETLGLAGESGCGKSTLGRLLLGLIRPTSGRVSYRGDDLSFLKGEPLKGFRRDAQIIFQNPYSSLNPRKAIRQIVTRPFEIHGSDGLDVEAEVSNLLEVVGLSPPENFLSRYPHELSGGQRQRIAIARAIALKPKFIVCDEPVSMLDLSIRAQILNLLKELRTKFNLTMLFITHDLSVLRSISDRVAIMYLGKIAELAPADRLFNNPLHPYTQSLLSAVPLPNPRKSRARKRMILVGEVPSPANPPTGCRFHTRCPFVMDRCSSIEPELRELEEEHYVACHLY